MRLKAELPQLRLSLYNENGSSFFDFSLNAFSASMTQRLEDMDGHLSLGSIEITETLFKYTNSELEGCLTSVPPLVVRQANRAESDLALIQMDVKKINKDHPEYGQSGNRDLSVKLKFGYLFLNLKPDAIEALMVYLMSGIPKRPADKQAVSAKNYSESPAKVEKSHGREEKNLKAESEAMMLKFEVELKQIGLRMIHRELHCCLAEFSMKDSWISFTKEPKVTSFECSLGNIQLLETTNYSNTTDSNIDYQKIVPYEMLGISQQGNSLVAINFKSYDPKSRLEKPDHHVYTYIDINISSLQANILQQPLLRIADFFTNQVAGVLELAKTAENESEGPIQSNSKAPTLTKHQAEQTLLNPAFMDIKLEAKSPAITLKPHPLADEFIEIRLGDITVSNTRVQNSSRWRHPDTSLGYLYCEQMEVAIQKMGIWKVEKSSRSRITREFNFDITLERLLFPDEYKLVYSEGNNQNQIDTSMIIIAILSPLIVILSKDDYRLLMKVVNRNLTFNDGLDELFEYKRTVSEDLSALSPLKKTVSERKKQPNQQPNPIRLQLKLQNIGLLILEENTGLPLTMINIHYLTLKFEKDSHSVTTIVVRSHDVNGNIFEVADSKLCKYNLLGSLSRETKYELRPEPQGTVLDVLDDDDKLTASLLKKEFKSNDFMIDVRVEIDAEGGKIITASVNQLRMYLFTSAYLSLANFCSIGHDADALPPSTRIQPLQIRSSDTSRIRLSKEQSRIKPDQPAALEEFTALNIRACLRNVLITMPSSTHKTNFASQVLTVKGNFNSSANSSNYAGSWL